jgi:hypothetical protein
MACPKARDYARMKVTMVRLQQGFAPSKMGFQVKLQGNNFKPPMSALGHKRTLTCLFGAVRFGSLAAAV